MSSNKNLSERRQQLSPAKQALLQKKLQAALSELPAHSRIPSRPGEASAPLSFSQEQIYFLQQLEPSRPTYNRPFAIQLDGLLDPICLQKALGGICRRHSILRSLVQPSKHTFVQVVQPASTFSLPLIDLGALAATQQPAHLAALLADHAQQPFDLSAQLPVRGWLFRLSSERHLLLLVFHHIVFDGWSARVFLKELAAFYLAIKTNSASNLPPLPIQYSDYSTWQRTQWPDDRLQTSLAYWKEVLAGLEGETTFPPDHPRPPRRSNQGAKYTFLLPTALSGRLRAFSLQTSTTPFMVLLASFAVLLHRCTGQSDLVIGAPSAGRTELETENLIGCFLNILALRVKLEGGISFHNLLESVRETALGAFSHQALPFERLVQELNPTRDLSRTPLFQVLFNLENFPLAAEEVNGLQLAPFEFDDGLSRFDLSVEITPSVEGLHACMTYDTSLYRPGTIQSLAQRWLTLLESLLEHPHQPIQAAALLDAAERQSLLHTWSQPAVEVPPACLHQLFEAQVMRTPQAPALVLAGKTLTYQELNEQSNRLAHLLLGLGVSSESLVGVHLPRSPELVISLLAVLKAGSAYLPLDPTLPPRRLAAILEDAQPPWVLSLKRLADGLGSYPGQTLCLDELSKELLRQPGQNPPKHSSPSSLAYIIYTSGSTGQPKGVLALHQGVANYLAFLTNELGLSAGDVVLNLTSFAFDPHARDLFGPLSCGAQLVLLTDEQARDPSAVLQTLQAQQVTHLLSIVPSFLRVLCDQAAQSNPFSTSLRMLLSGGERLTGADVIRTLSAFGDQVQVINQYGPSEVSMASAFYLVPASLDETGPLPIGRPVWNTHLYLLDTLLNPLPPGAVGEIYIAGAGLARGYLHDPVQTQARFVPDPFSVDPRDKMFRTGDLGRVDSVGNLHFLGRPDQQVKIRGFRIEPGEVAAVLQTHSAVKDSAVKAFSLPSGDLAMAAYWTSSSPTPPSPAVLREFLAERLPAYMLPEVFIQLEVLPNLPNGKVDLKSLPPPGAPERNLPHLPTPPHTPIEERLVEFWESLLGVSPVGIEDNFFALGGHSILVLRLFLEIERAFQVRLPLASIFLYPTVAGLAQVLTQVLAGRPQSNFTLLQSQGSFPPFFYMHTHHSYSSTILRLAQAAGKQQPFYAVQIPLPTWEAAAHTSLVEIARQTLEHLRLVQPHGPYYLGGYSLSGIFAFEMARQLTATGEEVALLALIDPSISILPGYRRLLPPGRQLLYHLGFLIYAFRLHLGNLQKLPLRQKATYLGERVAKRLPSHLKPASAPLPPDPYQESLAIQRSLSRRYPLLPYSGTIVLLKSINRLDRSLEPGWFFDRESSGWKRLASGKVQVVPIPGDHHSIITEQHIDLMAQKLAECLHASQTSIPSPLPSEDHQR